MDIIDAKWFGGGTGYIGIIRVYDEYEGIKYYIGSGYGLDAEDDKKYIAKWGSTFNKESGNVLFGQDDLRNGNAVPFPKNKEQAILIYQLGKRYLEDLEEKQ